MTNFLDLDPKYIQHARRIRALREANTPYSPADRAHAELINECVREFDIHFMRLESLDRQIFWTAAIGIGCFLAASFLPVLTIAFGAIAVAAYRIGLRDRVKLEYSQALENMVNCTRWSIGEVNLARGQAVAESSPVVGLVTALARVTTEEQRRELIDDTLPISVKTQYRPVHSGHPAHIGFDEHRKQVHLKLYGWKEGNMKDVFNAVIVVVQNWLSALFAPAPKPDYKVEVNEGLSANSPSMV